MTSEQAVTVLAYLTEAYRAEVTDTEAAIWVGELRPLDAELAEASARRCVRDSEFFPPIARFHAAYAAERRARAAKQPGLPAGASERVGPEQFQAGLDAARASLRGGRQP